MNNKGEFELMNNKNKARIFKYSILLTILTMGLLTGCGKKEVEYVQENSDVVVESQGAQSSQNNGTAQNDGTSQDNTPTMSTDSLREKLNAEESWAEDFDKETNVVIQTAVQVPDVNSVKVIEASRKTFTSDDKKELVSKLADGKVYIYPTEYEDMTKEQLEKQIQSCQERISYYESELANMNSGESTMYSDACDELEELQGYYEYAPEEYTVATNYDNESFLFDYNGKKYRLDVYDSAINLIYVDTPYTNNKVVDESDEGTSFYLSEQQDTDMENICKLTEEEAKNEAIGFVDSLGIGRFQVVSSSPAWCKWGSGDNWQSWCEGYVFKLYRNIDGVVVDGRNWSRMQDSEHPTGDGNSLNTNYQDNDKITFVDRCYENITVYVNDAGVTSFYYGSPMELGDVTATEVPLLTYEKIQNIIREEIMLQECYKATVFNNMCLRYFPLRDENAEGEFSIVPVWILSRMESGYDGATLSYVVVNAIDGSIVYIMEQYYDIDVWDYEDVWG